MDEKTSFFQSKTFKGVLMGLGVAVLLLLTFEAGAFVGYQKATFSSRWAENYKTNFFPRPEMGLIPPVGDGGPMNGRGMMNAHGAFGDIIKIENSSIVVKGADEAEKTILIQPDTVLERGFDKIKVSDLSVGDQVIIFGAPNDLGQILAKLIRLLPKNISFLP